MGRILDRINSPKDLKELTSDERLKLAEELRLQILETVSRNGGHLGPNLGTIELTIALHTAFNSPHDKIVWDVGHQAYSHKLLTGRRARFDTLRQHGGISGFPRRDESPHDPFGVGHASTSISAALGLAVARDQRGSNEKVIAVIGDGAMTGGLAFEGLNNAGHLARDLIVILNDNVMSISKNVGALSSYFNRVISAPVYTRVRDDVHELIRQATPLGMGKKAHQVLSRLEEGLKNMMIPEPLFQELGFAYYGPVDGHDTEELIHLFNNIREQHRPILIHAVTQKGKGYHFAEQNAEQFHGGGPFEIATGESRAASGAPTYTKVFSDTLLRLAEEDERIAAITAAMPSGTGLKAFAERFPERFYDVGIAEGHAVTFAAGLAGNGVKPVVALYSSFLQRAVDNVIHDAALQNLDVTICLDRAGVVGDDGETHQGLFDFSFTRFIPNTIVMTPKDENEFQHLLKTAVDHKGTAVIRYPRGQGYGVPLDEKIEAVPVGRAELLREGTDAVILAWGVMVNEAMTAAEELKKQGLSVGVVNMRFVKPLDKEMIRRVASRTRLLVTAEENALQGGAGSAVLEALQEMQIVMPTLSVGVPDRFMEHGTQPQLRAKYGLDAEGIAQRIREVLPAAKSGSERNSKVLNLRSS